MRTKATWVLEDRKVGECSGLSVTRTAHVAYRVGSERRSFAIAAS
jgi:hypothetical protein